MMCGYGVRWCAGLLAVFACASTGPGRARAQHADVLVVQSETGKLVTGTADLDHNAFSAPARLFSRGLDASFFGSDPGFNAVSAANVPQGYLALPAGTPLAFDFVAASMHGSTVANLWYWNGADANDVDFQPSAGTALTAKLTPFQATVDGAADDVAGFNLQTTSATGSMHRHANIQLAGETPQGLYLVALRMRMTGLGRSDPFYIVFATEDATSAAFQAATEWAADHLLVPGDANTDGVVDIFDVNTVSDYWGTAGPTGDTNYDGVVDIFDVNVISDHWGEMASANAAAVPEPASRLLIALGASGVLVLARRAAT